MATVNISHVMCATDLQLPRFDAVRGASGTEDGSDPSSTELCRRHYRGCAWSSSTAPSRGIHSLPCERTSPRGLENHSWDKLINQAAINASHS